MKIILKVDKSSIFYNLSVKAQDELASLGLDLMQFTNLNSR